MGFKGRAFGKDHMEMTGHALGSNVGDFGVDSNGFGPNVQVSGRLVVDRNQVVGDQGEQLGKDSRVLGTGTLGKGGITMVASGNRFGQRIGGGKGGMDEVMQKGLQSLQAVQASAGETKGVNENFSVITYGLGGDNDAMERPTDGGLEEQKTVFTKAFNFHMFARGMQAFFDLPRNAGITASIDERKDFAEKLFDEARTQITTWPEAAKHLGMMMQTPITGQAVKMRVTGFRNTDTNESIQKAVGQLFPTNRRGLGPAVIRRPVSRAGEAVKELGAKVPEVVVRVSEMEALQWRQAVGDFRMDDTHNKTKMINGVQLGAYEDSISDDLRGLVLQISPKDPRTGKAPWVMSNKLRTYLHLLHMAGADEERILQIIAANLSAQNIPVGKVFMEHQGVSYQNTTGIALNPFLSNKLFVQLAQGENREDFLHTNYSLTLGDAQMGIVLDIPIKLELFDPKDAGPAMNSTIGGFAAGSHMVGAEGTWAVLMQMDRNTPLRTNKLTNKRVADWFDVSTMIQKSLDNCRATDEQSIWQACVEGENTGVAAWMSDAGNLEDAGIVLICPSKEKADILGWLIAKKDEGPVVVNPFKSEGEGTLISDSQEQYWSRMEVRVGEMVGNHFKGSPPSFSNRLGETLRGWGLLGESVGNAAGTCEKMDVEREDKEDMDPEECALRLVQTIPVTGSEKVCKVCTVKKVVYGQDEQQACIDCWGHTLQLARAAATMNELADYVRLEGQCECEAKVMKLVSMDILDGKVTKCGTCWYSWYRNAAAKHPDEGKPVGESLWERAVNAALVIREAREQMADADSSQEPNSPLSSQNTQEYTEEAEVGGVLRKGKGGVDVDRGSRTDTMEVKVGKGSLVDGGKGADKMKEQEDRGHPATVINLGSTVKAPAKATATKMAAPTGIKDTKGAGEVLGSREGESSKRTSEQRSPQPGSAKNKAQRNLNFQKGQRY